MKHISIANKAIPLWLFLILIVSGIGVGGLAHYAWQSITIPFEVEKPLEILNYTSELSLFPGETAELFAEIKNHASINYSVQLEFQLSDSIYQLTYVTFSEATYVIVPGIQVIDAWLYVSVDAPPIEASLTIKLLRVKPDGEIPVTFEDDFEDYVLGEFPYSGGWQLFYAGAGSQYQVIVGDRYFSPTKSLKLLGWGIEGGDHMATVSGRSFVFTTGSLLVYEAYVMVDDVCMFDASAILGFGRRTLTGAVWANEVAFCSNGMIATFGEGGERFGTPLQPYDPDTWYKIEAILDTATDTYSIWIDDELRGSNFETRIPSYEIEYFLLASNYGNTKAYFDDVSISEIT